MGKKTVYITYMGPEKYSPPINTAENRVTKKLISFLNQERLKAGVLNEDGSLNYGEKMRQSHYDILSLAYYNEAVVKDQNMQEAAYKTDEEFREMILYRVQELIKKIVRQQPQALIFLDKSARPVSWMIRKFWPLFVPDGTPLPNIHYVNMDANDLLGDAPEDPRPTENTIARWHPSREQEQSLKETHNVVFKDYQKVMLIDEISVTGGTKNMSRKFIEETFPHIHVMTETFMHANIQLEGDRGYENMKATELPPWYNSHISEGRGGIGEPINNTFLSRRIPKDELGDALRSDIELLVRDVMSGKQSIFQMGYGSNQRDVDGNNRFSLTTFPRDKNGKGIRTIERKKQTIENTTPLQK